MPSNIAGSSTARWPCCMIRCRATSKLACAWSVRGALLRRLEHDANRLRVARRTSAITVEELLGEKPALHRRDSLARDLYDLMAKDCYVAKVGAPAKYADNPILQRIAHETGVVLFTDQGTGPI